MATVDFYYDFGSPNAYLAHKVLPGLAAEHGAEVRWKPILLGGVFKATNNRSPMEAFAEVRHKLGYMNLEIRRFVGRHGVAYRENPHFPVMTLAVMRGAICAQEEGCESAYTDTVFDAMWVEGMKMDDPGVMAEVLSQSGLPSERIMAGTQNPEIKARLAEVTGEAVERGVFGVPTMFAGDEMFFGKDSLDDLGRHLGSAAGGS